MDISGKKFVWSEVNEIHEIGEYTIGEFIDKN